jgi:periplasmic protein TonB
MNNCSVDRSMRRQLANRFVAFAAALLMAVAATAQDSATVYSLSGALSTQPQVIKSVKPEYTPAAKMARIQGYVRVWAVVRPDGTVGDAKIGQSQLWQYLGPTAKNIGPVILLSADEIARLGLDRQAINAAKQWLFKPGTKDGEPVAVRVLIELTFALGVQNR